MRKIKFIINPAAGKGEAIRCVSIIRNMMESAQLNYSISISGYKGNVEEISRLAVEEGYTDIVAVGGDGTVLETFTGLYGSGINLGVIPSGTGNDFVRMLNIESDYKKAIQKIINGSTKTIDIGMVNKSYFLNVVGIGIDGDIVERTQKVKKYFRGTSAYIYSTFATLIKYRCKKIQIEIDGVKYNREAYLVAIGNGKYYGGGMMVTPGAIIDDGMFEIIILNKLSKLKFAILFSKVFSGKHTLEKSVEVFYGKDVKVTSNESLKVNADGNIVDSLPAQIKIYSKAQNVII